MQRGVPAILPSRLGVIAAALALAPLSRWRARMSHARVAYPIPRARAIPYPRSTGRCEISGSQYAPVAWADIPAGARTTICRPSRRSARAASRSRRNATRPPIRRRWAARCAIPAAPPGPPTSPMAPRREAFFEQHFLPLADLAARRGRGLRHRLLRAGHRRLADADRRLHRAGLSPAVQPVRPRQQARRQPACPTRARCFARSAGASSCPITIAPRSRTARSPAAASKSAGSRARPICCSRRSRARRGSASRTARPSASITMRIMAIPIRAVGRILIDRGIIPKEQMSMQRIREWMEQNPDGAKELRRQNRSYVFFREVQLSDKDEAVGAQGVPLTPGRSIAVDKSLHVYGTPFFIEGELPIESEQSKTPFRRLMIAQDTGSAIVGPGARRSLFRRRRRCRAGVRPAASTTCASSCWCRRASIPSARGRKMPLPDPRPSEKIAKLFPQVDPLKDSPDPNGPGKRPRLPRDCTIDQPPAAPRSRCRCRQRGRPSRRARQAALRSPP